MLFGRGDSQSECLQRIPLSATARWSELNPDLYRGNNDKNTRRKHGGYSGHCGKKGRIAIRFGYEVTSRIKIAACDVPQYW